MGLFGLFKIVDKIGDVANANLPESASQQDAIYSKRILVVAGALAAVGVVCGLITLVVEVNQPAQNSHGMELLLAPIIFAVGGFLYGAAMMCAFAPGSFLSGKAGAPWIKLTGMESAGGARVVYVMFVLIVTAIVGWIALTSSHLF